MEDVKTQRRSRSGAIVVPITLLSHFGSDLVFDEANGVAYQRDRNKSVEYGRSYFDKYLRMEGTPIADALNRFRASLAAKHGWKVMDIGIGSGEFIKRVNMPVLGYDVNPYAVEWLKARGQFHDPYSDGGMPSDVTVVTMWDVLEHMPDPDNFLKLIRRGCTLLVSIPIFASLEQVKSSKHYRPDEHYWYFTRDGFIRFMATRGFQCLDVLDDETRAGRESILTFVFVTEVASLRT